MHTHSGSWNLRRQYLCGLARLPFACFAQSGCFAADGKTYEYIDRVYNFTWINERRVELAFAQAWLKEFTGRRVLEIGNVSSHYFDVTHPVVDRYERGSCNRLIAEDAVDFSLSGPFDLIFSISTFEHLGWDEAIEDPAKALRAISHARTKLSVDGVLRISLPIGFNPHIDRAFAANEIPYDRCLAMMRRDAKNSWQQVPISTALRCEFGSPYPFANALLILEFSQLSLSEGGLQSPQS